jgi:hypothetical protein
MVSTEVAHSSSVVEQYPLLDVYDEAFIEKAEAFATAFPAIAPAYFDVYGRLGVQAGNTSWMFPDKNKDEARTATVDLFGSTLPTVLEHYGKGEQTKKQIELIGRPPEHADLYGAEPLMLLELLNQAYLVAGKVMDTSETSTIRSVLAEQGNGYSLYRFIDTAPEPQLPPCVSLYIRPQASDIFNTKREYGGGAGVEASVSLRIDLKLLHEHLDGLTTKMIGLDSTNAANDGVICLRIDRSGVEVELGDGKKRRLPTTPDGTAAHDIASILRDVMGKFLAANRPDGLNHLPLKVGNFGDASVFGQHATSVRNTVNDRRIRGNELQAVLEAQDASTSIEGLIPGFLLGQSPYNFPGIRTLARRSGLVLGKEPNDQEIQELFHLWGAEKAFRSNIQPFREASRSLSYQELLADIALTGVMRAMPLRRIDTLEIGKVDAFPYAVIMEGTVGWMMKRMAFIHAERLHVDTAVVAATKRPLVTPTEIAHPQVVALRRQLGAIPTAVDFAHGPATDYLKSRGVKHVQVVGLPYKQRQADGTEKVVSGGQLAQEVVGSYPEIRNDILVNPLNAPAGAMFHGLLAALMDTQSFDIKQFYIGHTKAYYAQTPQDNAATRLYQNPYSVPSSLVRWIDTIQKLNQHPKLRNLLLQQAK